MDYSTEAGFNFNGFPHHINFNENRRILIKLSVFITIHHEIKCSCTLGQGCDAKVLSVLSESLKGWFGVQRTKTLRRTQVAHSSIDNQLPYPFIIHFESKIFKNQACTTSRGSSTRSKRQQRKVESGVSSRCSGVQRLILPAVCAWQGHRGYEYRMAGENHCACSLLTAVGADTNVNNPWTTSQNTSVSVVAKCDQVKAHRTIPFPAMLAFLLSYLKPMEPDLQE